MKNTATQASKTPIFTPVCRTAAIHGPHRRGQVSASKEEPTAHSPPIPKAARKRKIIKCHQVCAKDESPVNKAYVIIVRLRAGKRAARSPTRPKNAKQRDDPHR